MYPDVTALLRYENIRVLYEYARTWEGLLSSITRHLAPRPAPEADTHGYGARGQKRRPRAEGAVD